MRFNTNKITTEINLLKDGRLDKDFKDHIATEFNKYVNDYIQQVEDYNKRNNDNIKFEDYIDEIKLHTDCNQSQIDEIKGDIEIELILKLNTPQAILSDVEYEDGKIEIIDIPNTNNAVCFYMAIPKQLFPIK